MKEGEMVIPHLFRCPISLDLFTDPVTLPTGQTYDRSSIEKWLAAGNLTCPVTMQKLQDLSLVPNHTLRHLIDQWLRMGNRVIDSNDFKMNPSLAALKHLLESHESTLETKLQALENLLVLTQESPSQMPCLVHLGFLPLLLELVFGTQQLNEHNLQFVEQSLVWVLKMLPFGNLQPLIILKDESKLAHFVALFDHGNTAIKTSLCQIVEAISSSSETKELCARIGQIRGLINRMILLLHENSEASQPGIKVISALASLETNRESLVSEGAIDGLITYILSAERRERSLAPTATATAMAALEALLGLESAKEAVVSHPNGVNAIVKMVFRVSDHGGSESAVNALMIVCYDSQRAREEAIRAGVLTQLLLLLQSQCNGRTKTKARMLLKLLRSMRSE